MSRLLAFFLILGLAGMAVAADTGNRLNIPGKTSLPFDPNVGDAKEGGETIATAVVISALPYVDTGATCDNLNNYDESCPYTGGTAKDVVYSYSPASPELVTADLCYSAYDTKIYVYANAQGNLVACNDDFHFDAPCYTYSSKVTWAADPGNVYYIVVDGYSAACGTYYLDVTATPMPDPIVCDHQNSGGEAGYDAQGNVVWEPPLVDYYTDVINGGCNTEPPVFVTVDWTDLDTPSCARMCGKSGWYFNNGDFRDTDWFIVQAAGFQMTYTVCAELACDMYVLTPDCANLVALGEANTGGNNQCATITWATTPGTIYWLWVGPDSYTGPVNEFGYNLEVCGHTTAAVPTESSSWGAVKQVYR